MNNRLTKYTSFEAVKGDVRSTTLTATEKERLAAEAKQMAEILQAIRKEQHGTTRK